MKLCGPKLSLCGLIISVWGILQLGILGIFYWIKAVALLEDIPLEEGEHFANINDFYTAVDNGYKQTAINCWIAALLYVVTLVVSAAQFYANSRSSHIENEDIKFNTIGKVYKR